MNEAAARERKERLDRILRGGAHGESAGIQLSALFPPIVTHVYDEGSATVDELVKALRRELLGTKTALLRTIYSDEDPLRAVTVDGIALLADAKILTGIAGRWTIGPKFVPGEYVVVIPADGELGPREAYQIRVTPREEREAQSVATALQHDIASAAYQLRGECPGIRPVNADRVQKLAESMRRYGYNKSFPITYDQHGRLLDGRHRLAAAREVDETPTICVQTVKSDEDALAWAWDTNMLQASWSKKDVEYFTDLLGGRRPDEVLPSAQREKAHQAALREHDEPTGRSRQAMSKDAEVGETTMRREAAKFGIPTKPQAKRDEIDQEIETDPKASDSEIGRRVGVDRRTVAKRRHSRQTATVHFPPRMAENVQEGLTSEPVQLAPERSPSGWRTFAIKYRSDEELAVKLHLKLTRGKPDVAVALGLSDSPPNFERASDP